MERGRRGMRSDGENLRDGDSQRCQALESFRDRGGVRVESLRPGPPGTAAAFHWFPRESAKLASACLGINLPTICC